MARANENLFQMQVPKQKWPESSRQQRPMHSLEPAGSHREGRQKARLESVQKGGTKEGTEMLCKQAARLKEVCVGKVGLETITALVLKAALLETTLWSCP